MLASILRSVRMPGGKVFHINSRIVSVCPGVGLSCRRPVRRVARTRRSSDDPIRIEWSFCGFGFLLIVRSDRIFTVRSLRYFYLWIERVPSDTRMFQHMARFCNRRSVFCSTVIVTAAVYWGLSSKLRSKELTYPLDLPAPGRRQSVYCVLRLRTLLCF